MALLAVWTTAAAVRRYRSGLATMAAGLTLATPTHAYVTLAGLPRPGDVHPEHRPGQRLVQQVHRVFQARGRHHHRHRPVVAHRLALADEHAHLPLARLHAEESWPAARHQTPRSFSMPLSSLVITSAIAPVSSPRRALMTSQATR